MPKKLVQTKKPVRSKIPKPQQAKKAAAVVAQKQASGSVSSSVVDPQGKKKGTIQLPGALFASKVNDVLVSQAIRVYLANQRAGTASTKTRGEVEGSTRKIYRQKGTGRARHGGIRAPIFVGGGIAFGPKPRDYHLSLPKKMKAQALASVLTRQFQTGAVLVVDGLERLAPKTKVIAESLKSLHVDRSTLLVVAHGSDVLRRSARNIANVDICEAKDIHTYTVFTHKHLVFTKSAIPQLTDTFIHKQL